MCPVKSRDKNVIENSIESYEEGAEGEGKEVGR